MSEMRLIDANALDGYKFPTNGASLDARERGWNECIEYLKARAKTIDAVPVVHGRWNKCFEDWRQQLEGDECSVCGFQHYGTAIDHYHYCPNCGAKMDRGAEG